MSQNKETELFWRLRIPSILYKHFAYLDTPQYMADDIFIRHKLRIRYDNEYERPDCPYHIIFCHVFRNNAALFEKCMSDLQKKMLLCGHPNYIEECQEIMRNFA